MKRITMTDVIDFSHSSERRRLSFVSNLKHAKEKESSGGGGDYWVRSISAISNSFKQGSLDPIIAKKDELESLLEGTLTNQTRTMYQRNLDILYRSEDFDFDKWKPSDKMTFLARGKSNSILNIGRVDLQALPSHIFLFKNGEIEEVGAIWFVAKLENFGKKELGMFADVLCRYLELNFSEKYKVNTDYCVAVDVLNGVDINYAELEAQDTPLILDSIIGEIQSML